MPLTALAMVIIAAFTHATWNLLAKQAAASRHFVWLYSAGTILFWLPAILAVFWWARPSLGTPEIIALAGSAVLHTAYSLCLQRGYKVGDLSVVYPMARGTGPLISFFGAMLVLGERPGPLAAVGALLVVVGVFLLAGGPRLLRPGADRKGLLWGVLTGTFIAAYTVWDGHAVKVLLLSPLLVDYAGNSLRCLMLTPRALADRHALLPELRRYWKPALGVSVLGPLGYTLVLFAMQQAPVSHVAPARELSMMVGAWYGAKLLDEGDLSRRLLAAGVIVLGVVGLALG
ncbi:EamA family transporter [Chitinimonas arctica]|uniref:EamA family transporter n=1 Tax=Chitinimonas arctica TaxID=2594795 RepID=A0A516SFZ3_9NEIS|nr:DMT family transporter [Chitinimonas arctica]QDQ27086.1 EamA family transporter [Chitinimonas arctica]